MFESTRATFSPPAYSSGADCSASCGGYTDAEELSTLGGNRSRSRRYRTDSNTAGSAVSVPTPTVKEEASADSDNDASDRLGYLTASYADGCNTAMPCARVKEEASAGADDNGGIAAASRKGPAGGGKNQRSDAPHKCNLCKKRFKKKDNFRVHISVCPRLPQHVCIQCGGVYARGRLLTRHLRHCRPYRCACCKKSYATEHLLASHVCRFAGRDQYECSECELKFSCKNYLTTHYRRVHSSQWVEEGPRGPNLNAHWA